MDAAIVETYDEVVDLLRWTCHKFQKKWGGDFDDHFCEANFAFLRAYETYEQGVCKFSFYVYECVWRRLRAYRDKEIRRQKLWAYSMDEELGDGSYTRHDLIADETEEIFDSEQFSFLLTEDAKIVVRLVLSAPEELVDAVKRRGGSGGNWRACLRMYLMDSLGWSNNEVSRAYDEIRQVLDLKVV